MKKLLLLVTATFIVSSCAKSQKTEFSSEAMNEKIENPDGQQIAFSDILKKHEGKTTVIEFWASWCSDCVKAMPKVHEMQKNHPNVDYVFISLDKAADKWKEGIEKHKLNGDHYWVSDPLGMKGSFGKSVDLDWIPRYMILDKDGKIVTYRAIESDFDAINSTLKSLE